MTSEQKEHNAVVAVMVVISVLIIGGFGYFMRQLEAQSEARHAKQVQDCKDLNVSYGQSLTAKEGFYKGIEMMAVGAGEETIEVQYMKGFQIANARFLCADLVVK